MKMIKSKKAYVLVDPEGHVVEWAGAHFQRNGFMKYCLDGLLSSDEYDRLDRYQGWELVKKRGYCVRAVVINEAQPQPTPETKKGRE